MQQRWWLCLVNNVTAIADRCAYTEWMNVSVAQQPIKLKLQSIYIVSRVSLHAQSEYRRNQNRNIYPPKDISIVECPDCTPTVQMSKLSSHSVRGLVTSARTQFQSQKCYDWLWRFRQMIPCKARYTFSSLFCLIYTNNFLMVWSVFCCWTVDLK